MQKATFAAGCFWGVEARFREIAGVEDAAVGYTGGHTDDPDYRMVCSGQTGHAEAVELQFDPQKVSYEDLVKIFYGMHNPTTPNRQGPDIGTQYRSAIFYHDEAQKQTAQRITRELDESGKLGAPVVTEITQASTFWPAEEYHQQYLAKRGGGFCH